ncbi:hypothetical protein A4R26_17955 [Niastella populi]|uniref:Uncharacterized protein n=2 Tax=Niastella populi TaxID=550983 RepID=A0A1V9FUZ0_9BACT|nr:hypothetical protein A4R26_17955 [Niastella populi]
MNSRKPVLKLAILFIASFTIIGILAFLSKKSIPKKNGFERRFISTALIPRKHITFPVKPVKLIGMHSGKIFFQEEKPYEILTTTPSLDSLQAIKLELPANSNPGRSIRMFMQGHHLYLACRNMPGIIDYNLNTGSVINHALSGYFNQEAMSSTDNFIIRIKDRVSQSHLFARLNLNKKDSMSEDNFSDRKTIGGFETAGLLYYDTATQQACYNYFYQNGFICMDTNLNLTLKARTIDTVTHRNIKVARVANSLTMKQPPQRINYNGSVNDGKLFLQSLLKADNEYELDFNENTIIDVYSLKNGSYKGSFYIPAYEEKKAHQFQVVNQKLYALYGKTVVLYDLGFIADL